MFKKFTASAIIGLGIMAGGAVHAASVSPVSYDMPNGGTGSFTYFDDSYTGSGSTTTTGAALSGGVGDLTDGYIETQLWSSVESSSGGPNVGWLNINPVLTFFFDQSYQFETVTFYLDYDPSAGIGAPSTILINGASQSVPTPTGGDGTFVFAYDASGLAPTDTLTMQLNRTNAFIFASEITFDVAAVPLPAGGVLLLSGLGLMAARRRRSCAA